MAAQMPYSRGKNDVVHAAQAIARYADSIESLVRNNIQKMKIDMANEVIDAGRFDMNTTMDERRQTLEEMLQVRLSPALNGNLLYFEQSSQISECTLTNYGSVQILIDLIINFPVLVSQYVLLSAPSLCQIHISFRTNP